MKETIGRWKLFGSAALAFALLLLPSTLHWIAAIAAYLAFAFAFELRRSHRRGTDLTVRELYLRRIFEDATDAKLLVHASSLRIEEANVKACRSLGYTLQEIRALQLTSIVEGSVIELALKVDVDGAPAHAETYLIGKSEISVSVDLTISPISSQGTRRLLIVARDNSDRIIQERRQQYNIKTLEDTFDACLNVMEDLRIHQDRIQEVNQRLTDEIAEHRRTVVQLNEYRDHLEELVAKRSGELLASQEKLRKSERMASIGALAAGIAHEINNPIGAIVLSAQNILEMTDEERSRETIERFCNRVLKHAERCAQIVKGVLQFAKSEQTEKWPNNINLLINNSVQLVHELVKTRRATIVLSLDETLPLIPLNPIEIEQVFVNLLQNSLNAASSRAMQITISSERVSDGIRIRVADTGTGIPTESLAHVFDPFFSTRQQEGGTGLGLSIVHGIVTGHRGLIEIASQEGSGTCITLFFPFMDAALMQPEASSAASMNVVS